MTTNDDFVSNPDAGCDTVRAVPRVDPPGIELRDDIQGHTESLQTPAPVDLTECGTAPFCFPVDRAYSLEFPGSATPALVLQQVANVFVRDADARQIADAVNRGSLAVERGTWTVEVDSLGIKLYVYVDGALRSDIDDSNHRRLLFSETEDLRIGVRSLHEQPAATVTVGTDPRAIMRAVSCFGSALKTRSPERSFPTLRGHPPLLDVRKDVDPGFFDAPAGLERTPDDADVIIRAPERLESIYPVATLAYYLDAPVVPGEPALLTPTRAYDLTDTNAFGGDVETSAARLLKTVFTLDCVTRTEGFYRVRLGERERIEARLERSGLAVDWAETYGASLADRVTRYLGLPYDVVEPSVPRWPITAHVAPTPENASFLPFVADALGTVRTVTDPQPANSEATAAAQRAAVSDFLRDGPEVGRPDGGRSKGDRADGDHADGDRADGDRVDGDRAVSRDADLPPLPSSAGTITVPRTDAITDVWCAPGHPIGGAEPTIESCKRRLEATPSGAIDVAVVSNSPAMRTEVDVADVYGLRDLLTFDVSLYEDLTADGLRGVLAADHDLVHFVGHVSERGLQTADGWLDAETLPDGSVNTRAFVLNACRSYGQGRALVNAGAIGGISTISPIGNAPATEVGRTVARLLNVGFPLGGALDIVRDQTVTGNQYSIVGDPRAVIAEGRSGTAYRAQVDPIGNDEFRVRFHCYGSQSMALGSLFVPYLGDNDVRYLNSGQSADFSVGSVELENYFSIERFPVSFADDSTLYWSWELQSLDIDRFVGT